MNPRGTSRLAKLLFASALVGSPSLLAGQAKEPVSTRLDVHVVAHGAKLIGSAVGGAEVVVRDAGTGAVLARGLHTGGTGDTDRIMDRAARAGDAFTSPGAAVYSAVLQLREPRLVRVEATGPMDFPDARTTASTTLLVLPGQHLDGDGVVLELWGYIVEVIEPLEPVTAGQDFTVRARVRMLCSCPTEPGGVWEAGDVRARLLDAHGSAVAETRLEADGRPSEYAGHLSAVVPGNYEMEVVAVSGSTGNAGRVRKPLRSRSQ